MKFISVYTTVSTRRQAERIAEAVVKKRLAACANFFAIGSRYWWNGHVNRAREWAIIFKTVERHYPQLEQELHHLHPYVLPAIVTFPIRRGLQSYLSWIAAETTARRTSKKIVRPRTRSSQSRKSKT